MNVIEVAKVLNQRAVREKWYHYCDPTLAFSDPCYNELLDLWRIKAGDRRMPSRTDMTARELKSILRNILVIERVQRTPSRYRFRLVGTSLTSMAGELTGRMVDEIVPPEHLPRWHECCDLVLDGGKPMRFLGRVHLEGREYLDAENLYVPLANDKGEPSFTMAFCRYSPRHSESEQTWENQIASIPGALL